MLSLKQDCAVVPIGRVFATVIDEPSLRETRFNRHPDYVMHFLARGKNGELIKCMCAHERAVRATHEMKVGDNVIVDVSVRITAIDNTLEYAYEGTFICIDPRQ
jgi:hypothetical protein